MFRVFLYTSLLLFLTSSSLSAPIQLNNDDLTNIDDINIDNLDEINNIDLLNNKLTELDVNSQIRSDSYKKVLTFVKSIQDSIDKEHTELTRIFNAQSKEHLDRKKELDTARLSVQNLHNSLQSTKWKIGNLTNLISNTDKEHSKLLNTLEYHNQLLKDELAVVDKFYIESDKYKKYPDYSNIKKEIDELKLAVKKETGDIINIYSKLSTKIGEDVKNKKKELDIFNEEAKTFNHSLTIQTGQYDNLFNSFQRFVDMYNKNIKQYNDATNDYNKEKELLTQLSLYLQRADPEKCLKLTQDYNLKVKDNEDLVKQVKELQTENEILNNKINTLHKEINSAVNKSKLVSSKVVPGKVVGQTK